jgi:small subunit ribosomal protein S18
MRQNMARARTRRKDAAAERKPKKKVSILDSEQITWIDYKDVNLLRRFMSERAKIRARRVTGNDSQQQRAVARAIRVAREMALLPYSVRQVTHRNKGKGRGDRDGGRDGGRDLQPMPEGPGGDELRGPDELLEETIDVDVLADGDALPESDGAGGVDGVDGDEESS